MSLRSIVTSPHSGVSYSRSIQVGQAGEDALELKIPAISHIFSSSLEIPPLTATSRSLILGTEMKYFHHSDALISQRQTGFITPDRQCVTNLGNFETFPVESGEKSMSPSTFGLMVSWSVKRAIGPITSQASTLCSLTPSQRLRAESGEICSICLEDVGKKAEDAYTIAECKHTFHDNCIRRWKKEEATCPLCRGPLPEELGLTALAEQETPRPEFVRWIFNILPVENENPVTRRDIITNIFLSPLGLAWVLFIIPILLCFETLCIFFCTPVVLAMLITQTYNERLSNCCDLCVRLSVVSFLTLIGMVLVSILVFVVQIPFLIYISITFCFDVLRCKRRWQDAHSYITRRLIMGITSET